MSFFSIWLIWTVLIQSYRTLMLTLRTTPFLRVIVGWVACAGICRVRGPGAPLAVGLSL
jgi:hypothetical protein